MEQGIPRSQRAFLKYFLFDFFIFSFFFRFPFLKANVRFFGTEALRGENSLCFPGLYAMNFPRKQRGVSFQSSLVQLCQTMYDDERRIIPASVFLRCGW